MSATWELRGRVVVVTAWGQYDPQSFDRIVSEVKQDPRYQVGLSMLFDARRSEAEITKALVEEWVVLLAKLPHLGFSRACAVVVKDEQPFRFGMNRMAAARLEPMGVDLLVTRKFDKALAALTGQGSE